jgi:peptidoglycan lytic transglycosylase D
LRRAELVLLLLAIVVLAACPSEQVRKTAEQPPPTPVALQPLPLAPPVPVISAVNVPAPDAVDSLLTKAAHAYTQGMAAYRQGNLDRAKIEFDHALELMLGSGMDIEGDQRLDEEFDKLVENIYSAELAVVERGDALSAHNYEPAPLESFSGLTFPVDPHVRQRAKEEMKSLKSDLPLITNDYVAGAITFLQGRGSNYVKLCLKRIGLYEPMILDVFRKYRLPLDLIYLAGPESAYNPYALSRVGAKGMWQFMQARAEDYGLKKNRWVDEREDPLKSTDAAARHLRDLYQEFGDWYLAMAAYNCGPAVIQKAIEKTGYADYWKLRDLHALPADTENYVPVIIATALIAKDPKAYGFDVQPDPPLESDAVQVSTPTDLRLVAQLINHPVEDVLRLNPSLQRWTTPGNDPNFVLYFPKGTKDAFEQSITAIPEDKRVWWRAYTVDGGETVSSVARRFHISPAALAEVNQIDATTELASGSRLVLPLAPDRDASLQRVKTPATTHLIRYVVKSGDTLDLIADRFDVTPYQIRRWNHLESSRLNAGATLRLHVVSPPARSVHRSARTHSKSVRGKARRRTSKSHTEAGSKHPSTTGSRAKSRQKQASPYASRDLASRHQGP